MKSPAASACLQHRGRQFLGLQLRLRPAGSQTYFKAVRVEQDQIGLTVAESRAAGMARRGDLDSATSCRDGCARPRSATSATSWFWDGQSPVDPLKDASAQTTRLQKHTTTLAYEYAQQGRDWESELRQRAKEVVLNERIGAAGLGAAAKPVAAEFESDDANE